MDLKSLPRGSPDSSSHQKDARDTRCWLFSQSSQAWVCSIICEMGNSVLNDWVPVSWARQELDAARKDIPAASAEFIGRISALNFPIMYINSGRNATGQMCYRERDRRLNKMQMICILTFPRPQKQPETPTPARRCSLSGFSHLVGQEHPWLECPCR